jgi:hypothetical protein
MLINGIEIVDGQISRNELEWGWYLRTSGPFGWGSMVLGAGDLAAAGETIIWRELLLATFAPGPDPSGVRSVVVAEAARSGRPSHANRSGHPREAEWRERWNSHAVRGCAQLRRHGARVIDRLSVTNRSLFGNRLRQRCVARLYSDRLAS